MTREEFESAIDAIVDDLAKQNDKHWNEDLERVINQRWRDHLPDSNRHFRSRWGIEDESSETKETALLNQWVTGGVEGGNCWDDTSYAFTRSDSKTEFTLLMLVFDKLAPNLLFSDWKKINEDLIHRSKWTKYEYYGNCEHFDYEWIRLDDLYNFFQSCGLLPDTQNPTLK